MNPFRTIKDYMLLAFFVVTCSMAGCAALGGFADNSGAKLAVQYAVLKYTGGEPERAARVQGAVDEALALLEGNATAPVAALKLAFLNSVDMTSLDPADRLLANSVVDMVVAELIAKVGEGELAADQLLEVRGVLEWVRESAFFTATGMQLER